MTPILRRLAILSVYLGRGISPAAPPKTQNPSVTSDGCCLELENIDERDHFRPHPQYDWPDSDITLVVRLFPSTCTDSRHQAERNTISI